MNPPIQTRAFVIYVLGPCPAAKFYVGQTGNLARRLKLHSMAQGGCPELHKAIKRFGWSALPVQIVDETEVAEEADRLECLYITKFNALIPHGYNMTTGGRGQRFEPGAKVIGFTEHPVSPEEITEMARELVTPPSDGTSAEDELTWLLGCPCCGEFNDGQFCDCSCGVAPDFTRFILRHIAQCASISDLPLIDDQKLIKKWRQSRDADFFIRCEQRGVKGQTIANIGPYAAQKYAIRFWPYLEASLRRRCLIKKKLPTYSLGRFGLTSDDKMVRGERSSTEDYLYKNRSKLGSGESNIEVFAKFFRYEKNWCGKRYDIVIDVLTQHGGSPEEIEEAKRRVLFYRRFDEELFCDELGFPTFFGLSIVTGGLDDGLFTQVAFSNRTQMVTLLNHVMDLPPTERRQAMTSLTTNPPDGVIVTTKKCAP